MSELKFSCPACGQHISCSKAGGGHMIHCPNCCVELRIPFSENTNGELSESKAELVVEGSDHHAPPGSGPAAAVEDGKELHCRCPVCQSKLRIPASVAMQSAAIFPSAELVAKGPGNADGAAKPAPPAGPLPMATSLTEREQKIAAERAARPLSLYPQMKPRLNLLLGEKAAGKPKSDADEDPPDWMKKAA